MTTDDRTREAESSAVDILGARTGKRRGAAKVVPPTASPAATTASTVAPAVVSAPTFVQRSFYVGRDEWRAVQLVALAEGVTASEIVRRAIRAELGLGDTT